MRKNASYRDLWVYIMTADEHLGQMVVRKFSNWSECIHAGVAGNLIGIAVSARGQMGSSVTQSPVL